MDGNIFLLCYEIKIEKYNNMIDNDYLEDLKDGDNNKLLIKKLQIYLIKVYLELILNYLIYCI